jgi:hypothetical protein
VKDFPEPTPWNGPPRAQDDPGRSDGRPVTYRCLDCSWHGKGLFLRAAHWTSTQHHIVTEGDPRYERRRSKVG